MAKVCDTVGSADYAKLTSTARQNCHAVLINSTQLWWYGVGVRCVLAMLMLGAVKEWSMLGLCVFGLPVFNYHPLCLFIRLIQASPITSLGSFTAITSHQSQATCSSPHSEIMLECFIISNIP